MREREVQMHRKHHKRNARWNLLDGRYHNPLIIHIVVDLRLSALFAFILPRMGIHISLHSKCSHFWLIWLSPECYWYLSALILPSAGIEWTFSFSPWVGSLINTAVIRYWHFFARLSIIIIMIFQTKNNSVEFWISKCVYLTHSIVFFKE